VDDAVCRVKCSFSVKSLKFSRRLKSLFCDEDSASKEKAEVQVEVETENGSPFDFEANESHRGR
jgi:hypothetical protein